MRDFNNGMALLRYLSECFILYNAGGFAWNNLPGNLVAVTGALVLVILLVLACYGEATVAVVGAGVQIVAGALVARRRGQRWSDPL